MKEKDNIEQLIEENREALNRVEPPEGHFKRFEQKLEARNRKRNLFSMRVVWRVAAAVVFAFLVVNQGIIWLSSEEGGVSQTQGQEEMRLASVSSEYEEVEFYYANAIDGGIDQWEQMIREGFVSPEEQQMMETELEEFENEYERLQTDLAASPNDERVIQAMLDYYQKKLSLITMIVTKLEEVQQKKNQQL